MNSSISIYNTGLLYFQNFNKENRYFGHYEIKKFGRTFRQTFKVLISIVPISTPCTWRVYIVQFENFLPIS